MKLLVVLMIIGLCVPAIADENIIEFKDWRSDKVVSHPITEKAACVAKTNVKDKDTQLEVYAEASADGEYVQPIVQIVTTDVPPALGAVMRMSPGNRRLPMSISLSESKTIQKEVMVDGQPVMEDVEQQVFLVKFKNKKQMIDLIKAKNTITGTFFSAEGDVATMKFSLRGSHRSVSKMIEACL
ncbi:MAG: hypothetical protein HRT44_10240 [Bdellovibrionales bacterium]|nr:hypothetical protein [Bdellovibrionales bacterium]NQZ19619.1 hypothetical protein [Bdellovibrionales bacterium]